MTLTLFGRAARLRPVVAAATLATVVRAGENAVQVWISASARAARTCFATSEGQMAASYLEWITRKFDETSKSVAYESSRAPRAANVPRELVRTLIADHYPVLANDLLGPLLELLILSRKACGGDADKFLIMLVVARRTTEHELFASFPQEELLSGRIPVFPSLGTNISSVADSLGAPKETIRRKVADLVASGWIVRQGHELRFTARAYQELAPVRVAIERLAARNFETVNGLVGRAVSAR